MTGPGGTGKSYVVKAIEKVMSACGYTNAIRFVAPTGNTAVNIQGQTIHKAFSIKFFDTDSKSSASVNTYSIGMSPDELTRLRNEWGHILVLMIDEVSLLDQELLSQIDHTLRLAKNNDEYFGGIIVIFAGDFFQYPPVGGSPLYKPIGNSVRQNTDSEFKRRLGRVAWRSITDVVIFDEQQRMRGDPEYAAAVNRLRKRECTFDDVDLFNSRLIYSEWNKGGVDVGTAFGENTVVIVRTNKLRQEINMHKASSITKDAVIQCAAHDTVEKTDLPYDLRLTLLRADFSKSAGQRQLAPYLYLYEGMPVILKRNLSTELGIVNGAFGILRQLNTTVDACGFVVMSSAMVEFPESDIQLPGLPPKYFPLKPERITLSFKDANGIKKISRTQAPFEPAFGITGHGVQGQTCQHVVADLRDGGFASYVSASRPTSREGLAILQPVNLAKLNVTLPYDLLCKDERHEFMAENTMIKHGFMVGVLRFVPDSEQRPWLQ